jgi:glyoxylase-like metal-dependent hydrolase (beta-lactamase superfamily II)
MEVAAGVHRFTSGVPNWYLIEEGGKVLLVDAGTPADWRGLLTALQARGRTLADVDAVVLTHAHSDHTGFAEKARAEARARVLVHEADESMARQGGRRKTDAGLGRYLLHPELYRTVVGLARRGGISIIPIREVATFADGETLDVPGRPRVMHAPGHTAGCSAIWFESRSLVCTGDVLVTRNPLTGRRGPQIMPAAFNEDTQEALRSLERLSGIDAKLVLPGHGEPWEEGTAAAVRHARAAGAS